MKQVLFFIALISLAQIDCEKSISPDAAATSIEGKWRMTMVKDNASGLITTKPSSIQNDVEITFTSINPTAGTFTGNTPTNEIGQNEYSIGANRTLSIPALSMTKVAETSWGSLFVDNIRLSQEYSFGIRSVLNIKTTNKTLTFHKL